MKTRIVLRVARPCSLEWSELAGDGSVRHCGACNTAVHDLDGLRPDAVAALVRANPRGFCGRYTSLPGQGFEVALDESGERARRLTSRTALTVLATTLAACTRERVSEGPRANPSAARAVETVASGTTSPVPKAPNVSPSPVSPAAQLTHEKCETLQSLGYINVDCGTFPHEQERSRWR
jgi:hypothetical protein